MLHERIAALEKALEAQRQEVRARKFLVVDENGKVRVWLRVERDGPVLILTNEKGQFRVILQVAMDGGGDLKMWDGKGKAVW